MPLSFAIRRISMRAGTRTQRTEIGKRFTKLLLPRAFVAFVDDDMLLVEQRPAGEPELDDCSVEFRLGGEFTRARIVEFSLRVDHVKGRDLALLDAFVLNLHRF